MSLVGKTCWVVGGVGVVGKSITRSLLRAGATVIVNSRSSSRLDSLVADLDFPDRLVAVHGSLLPGKATKTVSETLRDTTLDHVVAHGAVRWWASDKGDETFSLDIVPGRGRRFLEAMTPEEFSYSSSQLATFHFSAAQSLLPRVQFSSGKGTYTFVTGDGSGKPGGKRSTMAEINSYHLWGLAAAMRSEMAVSDTNNVLVREIRIGISMNRAEEEIAHDPRERRLSEDTGDICAGLISNPNTSEEVLNIDSVEKLISLRQEYAEFT